MNNVIIPLDTVAAHREHSEFKKVMIGFIYTFAVEIIFFLIAAVSIAILWYLIFHCMGKNDMQEQWVYDPYEIKYITIVVGGYRRRTAVKRYFRKHKIMCHS